MALLMHALRTRQATGLRQDAKPNRAPNQIACGEKLVQHRFRLRQRSTGAGVPT